MPWQRTHADYCGPFLKQFYALILIDSYSKWTEVFLTTKADGALTKLAMRGTFSREGVPLTVVTDNGTHITSSKVQDWLKSVGCRQVFTAPRHPETKGLAENFVKTLKNAVRAMAPASFQNLEQCIDSFRLQYRNANMAQPAKVPQNYSRIGRFVPICTTFLPLTLL